MLQSKQGTCLDFSKAQGMHYFYLVSDLMLWPLVEHTLLLCTLSLASLIKKTEFCTAESVQRFGYTQKVSDKFTAVRLCTSMGSRGKVVMEVSERF